MNNSSNNIINSTESRRECLLGLPIDLLSPIDFIMVYAVVYFIAFVLLSGYGNGNTIRDNAVDISASEPIIVKPVAEADIHLNMPSIVALQRPGAGNPPRQCAGIGQAVS